MRTRRTLVVGFAGLCVLIAASGIAGLWAGGRLFEQAAALQELHTKRTAALDRLREAIYLSMDADPNRVPSLAANAEAQLRILGDASLAAELRNYWKVLDLYFEVAARERRPGVEQFFRAQQNHRRDAMFALAARLEGAFAEENLRQRAALSDLYRRYRFAEAGLLLLTLLLASALAVVIYRRIARLDAESSHLSSRLLRVQEDERKAIARELHDEVGASLSTLLVEARAGRLDEVRSIADRCVNTVRALALALRPSMLDDLGLTPALEWQAREITRSTGLAVQVSIADPLDELPDDQRTCIYRIVQEALRNAARHASARLVKVNARRDMSRISVEVEDDGRGFDPKLTGGLGLLGMRERVRQLRGRLEVNSRPGEGTRIQIELPL